MKRGGFAQKPRPPRAPIVHQPLTRAPNYARSSVALPVPKLRPVRSEEYLRLVAARPCVVCRIEGYSQAAHPNFGKGMSIKADDLRCFPLCADRPGERGCHWKLDQGAGWEKAERRSLEPSWALRTIRAIIAEGNYPGGLPIPEWAE